MRLQDKAVLLLQGNDTVYDSETGLKYVLAIVNAYEDGQFNNQELTIEQIFNEIIGLDFDIGYSYVISVLCDHLKIFKSKHFLNGVEVDSDKIFSLILDELNGSDEKINSSNYIIKYFVGV